MASIKNSITITYDCIPSSLKSTTVAGLKKNKSPKTPKMSLYLTQKFVIFAKSFFHKKFPRRFSEASKSVLISDVHMTTKSFENFARKNYFFLEK